MNIRTRRLTRDYEMVSAEFANNEHVNVQVIAGDPPNHYLITYHLNGITWDQTQGTAKPITEHIVDITLPLGYPKQTPRCIDANTGLAPKHRRLRVHWRLLVRWRHSCRHHRPHRRHDPIQELQPSEPGEQNGGAVGAKPREVLPGRHARDHQAEQMTQTPRNASSNLLRRPANPRSASGRFAHATEQTGALPPNPYQGRCPWREARKLCFLDIPTRFADVHRSQTATWQPVLYYLPTMPVNA